MRKKVFKPSAIVHAFEACGYRPFSFENSFAYKRVPPPTPPPSTPPSFQAVTTPSRNHLHLHEASGLDVSTHDVPGYAQSTESLCARKTAILRDISMRLNLLNSNPTPRRLCVINDDLMKHARCDAGRNEIIGAYRELSRLQKEVIDGQNARHLLAGQYQDHLRQQLASKSQTKTTRGGVLKSGYGALDEAALAKLEAELEAKEAAEVAKVLAREEHERMRAAEKL